MRPIQTTLDLGLAQQEAQAVFIKALLKDLEPTTTLGDLFSGLLPDIGLSDESLDGVEMDAPTRTAVRCLLGIRIEQITLDRPKRKRSAKKGKTGNKNGGKK